MDLPTHSQAPAGTRIRLPLPRPDQLRVIFRTRGSADGSAVGGHMRAVAGKRFPTLLDPSFEPDRSLLFELTSDKAALQIARLSGFRRRYELRVTGAA